MVQVSAKLVMITGPSPGQEIDLQHDVTTLGRAVSCQVIIEGEFASRRHAQIIRRDEVYWLRDLDSKNGTYLDGELVAGEVRLDDGAEIRIGETSFHFYDLAATRTHPAVDRESGPSSPPTPLQVIAAAREVWVHGQKLDPPLSPKQFDLLCFLWRQRGQAVSKDDIAAAVWPEAASDAVYDYQIDKMVSRLRERLGKEFIETIWGFGYKLVFYR